MNAVRTRVAVVCALLLMMMAFRVAPEAGGATESCALSAFDGQRVVAGRTYVLHVPAGLSGTAVPLLVSLHGFSNDGEMHAQQSGWRSYADEHNFIVAFPDGMYRSWNWSQWGTYDVAFLRRVVSDIAKVWCVDPHHVHVSGHSNGAWMSQRVACDAADLFASATEYAGGAPDGLNYPCKPSRPIAVGLFHGDHDIVVAKPLGVQARDGWVVRNGCQPTPTRTAVSDGEFLRYTGCRDQVEVTWRTYSDQGHLWPSGTQQQAMLDAMWTHAMAHPLP